METISVKEMKKWAKDTLPPMAWQRVTFRILPQLNKLNVFLHFLEQDDYLLKDDVFKTLDNTFQEIFGKRFTDNETLIPENMAIETLPFVPTVVPVEKLTITPTTDIPSETVEKVLKSFEKRAERENEGLNIPVVENVEEILPVVEPIVENVEQILPVVEPIVEKTEEVLLVVEPIVEKTEEVSHNIELIAEKVEEILHTIESFEEKTENVSSVDTTIEENLGEILPNKESVLKELEDIKVQLTDIINEEEEEKEAEMPISKPFIPFFSFEQLKRIFGKK